MKFELQKSIAILERTPSVLNSMLIGLPKEWTHANEGPDTWSPYDVIGHLIHGEKTDWMARTRVILSDAKDKTFVPFDRWAQMNQSQPSTLSELLTEFDQLRQQNLKDLIHMELQADDLCKTGIHPELGQAALKELLASWVVHDLGHISQISRTITHQYKDEVGPWKAYLTILKK